MCDLCNSGYYLKDGACSADCTGAYYVDGSNCISCGANTTSCTYNGETTTVTITGCDATTHINNDASACVSSCESNEYVDAGD